jgi:Sec-independent protein translocase protein TatA
VFGVSFQELAIVALIALVLLGPDRIPQVARGLARAYRELTKVRRHVDTTLGEIKSELQLDDFDLPAARPPAGKRVPLDQLHAVDDVLAKERAGPSPRPERLEIAPEDDYLGR